MLRGDENADCINRDRVVYLNEIDAYYCFRFAILPVCVHRTDRHDKKNGNRTPEIFEDLGGLKDKSLIYEKASAIWYTLLNASKS